jgi:hypothetical protein
VTFLFSSPLGALGMTSFVCRIDWEWFFHQITNVGQNLSGKIYILGWLLVNNLGGKKWVDNEELVLVVWFLLQSESKINS